MPNYIICSELYKFPHPSSERFINFANSTAFAYEAAAVRKALMEGRLESEEWPAECSIRVAKILTKARLEIGYVLPCDE